MRTALLDALRGTAPVMFLALASFGAIAKQAGFDLTETGLSSIFLWALPAQIAHTELITAGASLLSVVLLVAALNLRFLPMIASLYAHLPSRDKFAARDFIAIHLITPATWTWCLNRFEVVPLHERENYLLTFGFVVWVFGVIGSIVGYVLVDYFSTPLKLLLMLIAPIYMLLLLVQVRNHRLVAVIVGALTGYMGAQFTESFYLILAGAVGGFAGFWLWKREVPGSD